MQTQTRFSMLQTDVSRVCNIKADVRPILKMKCFFCAIILKNGAFAKWLQRVSSRPMNRPPSVPIWFVPQKKGLIWWVPWEWKTLEELNFHMEHGSQEAKKLPNRCYHMSRSKRCLSEFFFVLYCHCRRHFSGGDHSDLPKSGELLHLWFCFSLCKMSNLAPGGV